MGKTDKTNLSCSLVLSHAYIPNVLPLMLVIQNTDSHTQGRRRGGQEGASAPPAFWLEEQGEQERPR